MRAAALLLVLAAAAAASEPVEAVLLRARHAHYVRNDPAEAIKLYRQALQDGSLDAGRQAEVHLRIALCHEEQGQWAEARDHLSPGIYDGNEVAPETRRLADSVRRRIEAKSPPRAAAEAAPPDREEQRRKELLEHVRLARRHMRGDADIYTALLHIQMALQIDPAHGEARELEAEWETRFSGVAEFVRDPLKWLGSWTEARVTQVAQLAEAKLQEAVMHAERREHNLADSRFREAIEAIDASEFRGESDRLVALRQRAAALWRDARAREGRPEPEIPEAAAARTLRGEYLDHMQRMLDVVSAPGREYRILPVQAPRGEAPRGWTRKPPGFDLFRDLPSAWTPALFAQRVLPLRVHPESWTERGSFLEASGDMLAARNRPPVLDTLQHEVRRMAEPEDPLLPARFLLVSVPRAALAQVAEKFGAPRLSEGRAPVHVHQVAPQYPLLSLYSFLRDIGADVRPARDVFALDLANGRPQTLFVGVPLQSAVGYADYRSERGPVAETHFGVLIDVCALRDVAGRTAVGMKLSVQVPAAPLLEAGRVVAPRFAVEQAELFADLRPGETLLVTGLKDPFAAGRGDEATLLLLWANSTADGAAPAPDAPAEHSPLGADVSLRRLLLEVQDDPGPKLEAERGFVARSRLEILAERARFLELFLREALGSDEVSVAVEEGVLRVPPALRENAAEKVAELERESERSYVVRLSTRAVRSAVLERWMEREGLAAEPFGGAAIVRSDEAGGDALLRTLEPTEPEDVFAPRGEWPKPTALGLQARHAMSARVHTAPVYAAEQDLATGRARTVAEGLRVSVRPYRMGGRLLCEVEIQTAGLEGREEERALSLAVPSYRTTVSGTRVAGIVDLGAEARPGTVLFRGIPHPTASRPERLVEIVVALWVRHIP